MKTSVDIEALSAREIKEQLADAHVDFSDCFEKSELLTRLKTYISRENSESVLKAKACANEAYSRSSYALAIRYYSDALGCLEANGQRTPMSKEDKLLVAQIYSNRSLAQLRLNQIFAALADARKSVQVLPTWPKAYLRLGNALALHGRHKLALSALRKGAAALESGEADAKLKSDFEQRIAEEAEICQKAGEVVSSAEWEAVVKGDVNTSRVPYVAGSILLETLSDDALVEIMGVGLSAADVCRMAQCCRQLRSVCVLLPDNSSKLWQAVCERTWPTARDWRSFCQERHMVDVRWREAFTSSNICVFKAEEAPVFNVHRQGDLLASAEDSCIKLWDIPRKKQKQILQTSTATQSKMCLGVWLHSSQQKCLSGGSEGDVKVWDVRKGTVSRVLAGHGGPIVSLHADDETIFSTSFDGTCRVWNWQGRTLQTLVGHVGHVCGLSVQPNDNTTVWTGADDGLVKKWDVERGTCLLDLEAHDQEQHGSVWCVQVKFCGHLANMRGHPQAAPGRLVSASTDSNLGIWDTNAGTLVTRLEGHAGAVAGLFFDSDRIISCAFDGTVRLWDWKMLRCRGCVRVESAHGGSLPVSHYRRCTRLQVHDTQILVGCIDGNIYQIDVY